MENDKTSYQRGEDTHHMKGTVIPSAKNRDNSSELRLDKVDQKSLGVTFDIQNAVEMNIVETDANGGVTKVRKLDKLALEKLKSVNASKAGAPITYDQAIDSTRHRSSMELSETAPVLTKQAANPGTVAGALASLPAQIVKTMVRFTGPFGSLRVGYDRVIVNNGLIILINYGEEPPYEAPADMETHTKIEASNNSYWCLGTLQYTIPEESTHTIFIIDPEYDPNAPTQEYLDGEA